MGDFATEELNRKLIGDTLLLTSCEVERERERKETLKGERKREREIE